MRGMLLSAALFSATLQAAVPAQEAERLRGELTPLGAIRAASADGAIPAWRDALEHARTVPDKGWWEQAQDRWRQWRGETLPAQRYTDPFVEDQPLFTITAANRQEYGQWLSAGQQALFDAYPDSYRLPVYPSRRPVGAPDWVYAAVHRNALNAELDGSDDRLRGAMHGIPFPIPGQGAEVIWNHKLRYRGQAGRRWNVQSLVNPDGAIQIMKVAEDLKFRYYMPEQSFADLDNVYYYVLQMIHTPERMAGAVVLVHETMDQVSEPRKAWVTKPGSRRLRAAPTVGYDNPGTASDGQRTNDQADVFNGAMDRYDWRLVERRDMIVPYNSYRIHAAEHGYADILTPRHINQDLTRYERHRVWVVEATVKPRQSHLYKRRTFYVDEDSWTILGVDVYDQKDELWRVQEAHTFYAYDQRSTLSAIETVYDIKNQRYLTQAMNNEDAEWTEREIPDSYYAPPAVQQLGRSLQAALR